MPRKAPISEKLNHSFGYETVSPYERQQRIRTIFDAISGRYDLMNDLMSMGIHRLWKRRFIQTLPKEIPFVDLAGGTGDIAALLVAAGVPSVTVVDPSIPMMKTGQQRHPSKALTWVAGTAEQLPFADNSTEALSIAFGLRNTTQLDFALAEIYRVLVPGGTFSCLEFSTPQIWLRPFYHLYSFHIIPRLGAWVAKEPAAYQYLVESIRCFPDQIQFAALLEQTGFESVTWENLSFGIACIHQGKKPAS